MENEAKFESYYQQQLLPRLKELELERKEVLKKVYIALIVCSLIFIVMLVIAINFEDNFFPIFFTSIILDTILFFILKTVVSLTYKENFKEKINHLLLGFFGQDLVYEAKQAIPESFFLNSFIFRERYNRYKGEDFVSGTYDGMPISFSELAVEHVTGSGKNKKTHTLFRGVFTSIQIPRNIFSQVYILPDVSEKLFGRTIGDFFQSMGTNRGELIKTQFPEFEKEFVVYSTNRDEAMTIINADFVKKILDLKYTFLGKLYVSFIDNRVNIAIFTNKDMCEARLFKTIIDYAYIREQISYFDIYTGLINKLDLRNI